LAPPTSATTRMFAKVVVGRSTSRSVPSALFRLHATVRAAVFSYILGKRLVPGTAACDSALAALRRTMTHRTIATCIYLYCCASLQHCRALRRVCGVTSGTLAACTATAANIRRAVAALGITNVQERVINITLPAAAAVALPASDSRAIWNAVSSAVGVKTRIPVWAIQVVPNARQVYRACIVRPMQLTDAFARSIGLWHPGWATLFESRGAKKTTVMALPVRVRAALYFLAHANAARNRLQITVHWSAASGTATVCGNCVSLRSKPRAASTPFKRACSGVQLDLRLQQATCADCASDHLHTVALSHRQISVVTLTGLVCLVGCSGCGSLMAVRPKSGSRATCHRCTPPVKIPSCFCRASAKATTGTFLCTTEAGLAVSGVCGRHSMFVPASIEALPVVARRAGVRI